MAQKTRGAEMDIESARNEENLSAFQQDVESIEQSILSEFDQDVENVTFNLKIYRVVGNSRQGGTEEWIFNCDPSELPIIQRLRDEFTKPGESQTYRVRVIRNKVPYRQWDYRIYRPSGSQSAETRNDLSGFTTTIAEMFREQQRQTLEILHRMEQRNNQPAANFDPMAMLSGTVALITNLQNAIPKPENNMIEIFKLGMEMKETASGGGGDTGIMDVLKSLAEKIDFSKLSFPVAQPQPAPRPVPIPSRPMPDRPSPHSAPQPPRSHPEPHPAQDNPEPKPLAAFAPQLALLVSKAARGGRAEVWADVMDEELPDPAFEFLMGMDNETLLRRCADVEPRILQHQAWFERLVACLREIWDNSGEADPETAPVLQPELHDTGRETVNLDGDTIGRGGNGSNAAKDESVAGAG